MSMVQVWPHQQWLTADTWRPVYVAWLVDDDGDFIKHIGEAPNHITAYSMGCEYAEQHGLKCFMHDELPEGDK
jgi:hypothetical protein